ncbi:MAG: hypothetical protein BGO82_05575 [Devosia sp. 67-54]|uniref:UvrD-helicase domain-containing protein n=1 Tax=unclassified Devosia TaxID=196773 RepID=UPI000963C37F|nr:MULTISPECIES: UvrD-helicase domain-containing protein [unclassified Devosia]MBN9306915.1 UvrD-helicase domain-containing protein [Devosia sp.]OJX16989.1 MAG: hypothetical protein BGO82_05575 [Devosia sp. 67-54]
MSSWLQIRLRAQQWHDELAAGESQLISASELIRKAMVATGTALMPLAQESTLLDGAQALFDPDGNRILYSKDLSTDLQHFYIAHEFAHIRLHNDAARCHEDDFDAWTPAEPEESAVGEDDSYSPKQRREAQANVFARELLLPREKLSAAFVASGATATGLARRLEVPETLVLQQLADALLLPDDPPSKEKRPEPKPDPSQERAIKAPIGPHQVRAGPGTGKTRTLVRRIAHLIHSGEAPTSILALTYSNESAQDLATRVRDNLGDASTGVWTGTFHAFGLELMRLYWAGPNDAPYIASRSDQLFLLEELLPQLDLNYYFELNEPLRSLKSVLGAISRAKDELCGPAHYAELAAAMKDVDPEASARAAEVARIYEIYDRELRKRGWLDFGDLIGRPIEILASNHEVQQSVRSQYRNVLVDEYQDTNRASGVFLSLLVDPQRGPWVVGDVKQSIYRFRGASPVNFARFRDRFAGAGHTDLEINYRSGGQIVSTFETFGRSMKAVAPGDEPPALRPDRGETTGTVVYNVAATREAEYEGIAGRIETQRTSGGSLKDHAVLARAHSTLVRLTEHLERAGIPTLYFGDFFERPEVRDMLSLLSVASERDGLGLFRVGQWPRYDIPVDDILTLLHAIRESKTSLLKALRDLSPIEGISAIGRQRLARLAADLAGVHFGTSPHWLLSDYLFNKGAVREDTLREASVAGQQRRLAMYQLLQVTYEHRRKSKTDPKRDFLEHVRRLEILDEEKEFRRLPAAAAGIDAVKLMTVHASKGLEFNSVHVPSLSPSYFPLKGGAVPCPPPDGMIEPDPLMSPEMEEKSLFFVALSRARDHLGLSRSMRYGGQPRPNPSSLLESLQAKMPEPTGANWISTGRAEPAFAPLAGTLDTANGVGAEAIERYQKCPRRFYYQDVLSLRSSSERGPYLRFLSVVRSTLKWMNGAPGSALTNELDQQFNSRWSEQGPTDHPHSEVYQTTARRMLAVAAGEMAGENLDVTRHVDVGTRRILLQADNIQLRDNKVVIQRLKAGRLAKKETQRARDKLLFNAVSRDHSSKSVIFEHVSLLTGDRVEGAKKPDAEITTEVSEAFAQIDAGRFDPKPSGRECPTCPYYFICPSTGLARA